MKVLILNPPQSYYTSSIPFSLYFPIGLLSLASLIRDICDVKILDCLVDNHKKKKKAAGIHGMRTEEIIREVKQFNPDIIAISVPFSTQSNNISRLIEILRKFLPKCLIVLGGPDPTVRYPYYLKNGLADYCIIGEAEISFRNLIKKLKLKENVSNIEGIAYLRLGSIHYKNGKYLDNLDELPFPAYDLIDMDSYLNSKELYLGRSSLSARSISITTSRGCPYSCTFCSISLHMGKDFRYNSPGYVIRHLNLLNKTYGIKRFHFEDDNLTLNKERIEMILDKIIEQKMDIQWDTPNGVRADTLDYDLLVKMKKAGCKHLTIAIESGDNKILRKIKKGLDLKKVEEIANICKKIQLRLSAFYIIGFPGETIANMRKTSNYALSLLRKYEVIPNLNIATPLYGTELYDECIELGILPEEFTDEKLSQATQIFGTPIIETAEFSKEDVINVIKEFKRKLLIEASIFALKNPFYVASKIMRHIKNGNLKYFI